MIIRKLTNGYYAGRLSGQEVEIVCATREEIIKWLLVLKQIQTK